MRLFLLILLNLSIIYSFGQKKFLTVEYVTSGVDYSNKVILQITDTFSYMINNDLMDQTGYSIKNTLTQLAYKNYRFFTIRFDVVDTLNKFNWELTNDTTTILGLKCNSAKTFFRGRHYKVFYANEINYSDGPWKFCGLPGLILHVKSEDNYIEWKAVNLEYLDLNDKIKTKREFLKNKFLTWDDFVLKYKEAVKRYIKGIRSSGRLPADGEITLKIEDLEIFYPELQTGEGIKF